MFDSVIDGNKALKAKPDPQVFLMGAEELGIPAGECVVFEDAEAGVEAAHNAGMIAVGIGSRERLPKADFNIPGFQDVTPQELVKQLEALRLS